MSIDALLSKYDIYYIEPGATKMGFMLAQGANGVKAWGRTDERGLPDSYAPGDISYANLSPDIQKIIAHRYFNAGLGALEFEVDDDETFNKMRYLRSVNVDLRCKNKAYLGPKVITLPVYQPTKPTIANHSFETWAEGAPSSWAHTTGGSTSTIEEEATTVKDGAKAAKMVFVYDAGGAITGTLTLTLSNPTYYIGHALTFTAWVYQASNTHTITSTLKILRNDAELDTDATTTKGSWVQLTVTYTPTMGTTSLKIQLHSQQSNSDGTPTVASAIWDLVEDSISYATLGIVHAMTDFNGKRYFGTTTGLFRLNDAGTELLPRKVDFGKTITSLASFIDDNLYIALGAADKYWYMDTDEAFTERAAATGDKADKFCRVGTTLKQLVLPNKIRSTTDPTDAGAWGEEKTVGSSTYNVNDLKSYLGLLWCMKEDGAFYLDSDNNVQQPFPSLATIAHSDSGKNSDVFRNKLYFRMGNQQEWEIDGSDIGEITPALFAPGIAEYNYPCVARTHDESWLYEVMNRGANDLAILAGRWEYIAYRTRWVWHEIRSVTEITNASCAGVSSVEGRPYLYIGSATADEPIVKVYLPVTNDATADSGYRHCLAGSLYSPRYMTALYAYTKRWRELFARSENLNVIAEDSEDKYINVYRSTDDGGSFPLLGKLDTSPEQTLSYPSGIEGKMMNLRYDFVSDADSVSPVLKWVDLKAMTLVPSVVRFRHIIKCADKLKLKKGIVNYSTASEIRTFIDSLRDNICTLGDRWGNEHTVRVRVEREDEVFDEDTNNPETQFTMEAVKL